MNFILIAVLVLGAIALIAALVLFGVSKKFAVEEDPRLGQVGEILPGANCGGCGFAGCSGMAAALVKGADAGSIDGLMCPVGGADAFALADVSGIRIAAGVRNIGGKIKSSEGSSFSLPASVSAGVAYRFVNTEQHHIEAGADADIFIDGGASASVGVEYSYRNAAFARLGYNYASDKAPVPSFASVGIGFRIRSVRIDASYILPEKESPQKNTFSAGVGIWF